MELPRRLRNAELTELEGFHGDLLVDRSLGGVHQGHLEGQGPRGSNSLRTGPLTGPHDASVVGAELFKDRAFGKRNAGTSRAGYGRSSGGRYRTKNTPSRLLVTTIVPLSKNG